MLASRQVDGDVSELASSGGERQSDAPHGGRPPMLGNVLAGLVILAAVAAVAVFARTSDPPDDQIAGDVVVLQARGPTRSGEQERRRVRALPVPDLRPLGWSAAGRRVDTFANRAILTVYHERAGRQVAFSVLSGQPLLPPQDATRVRRSGVLMYRLPSVDRTAVTWRRGGRTVVMSSVGLSPGELMDLVVRLTPEEAR